jgi:serine/threonine protein kinase
VWCVALHYIFNIKAAMMEQLIEMNENMDNMPSLRSIRLVGRHLVEEPVQTKEPVVKTGSVKDLFVYIGQDSTSQRMCLVADEYESAPYEIDKRIKEAICGDVYTGFKLQASDNGKYKRKELVVIKIISMQKMVRMKDHGTIQENPIKELAILQMLDDNANNVCSQIDCIRDDKYIYSIMNHYGEELFNYAGKLTEQDCRNYFRQIVNGVEVLQMLDICHRDLSLENILLQDGVCTIIDFGMSLVYPTAKSSTLHTIFQDLSNQEKVYINKQFTDTCISSNDKQVVLMPPQGTCGKMNYIAPEILSNLDPFNGAMVDNWSLGVILFMLLTGRPPFHRASPIDKWYRMIQQGKLKAMLAIWKIHDISEAAVDLLQKLLKGSNYNVRMTTADILNDPWLL